MQVLLLEEGGEEPLITNIPAYFPASQKLPVYRSYKTVADNNSCLASNGCVWVSGKVIKRHERLQLEKYIIIYLCIKYANNFC